MVSRLYQIMIEECRDEKVWNRYIAYNLHHDDIEIEKAKGKYMRLWFVSVDSFVEKMNRQVVILEK